MKNKIKILTAFLSATLLLTGCSSNGEDTKKVKNKPVEQTTKEENKTTTTESSVTTTKEENKVENKQNINHDSQAIINLVNDAISIQVNSFDIKNNTNNNAIPGLFTVSITSNNFRKIKVDNTGEIWVVQLADFVDTYNTYNRGIYNEDYVLNDIFNKIKSFGGNSGINVIKEEGKIVDKSDNELKQLVGKHYTFVYFKGDKTFAYNIPGGLGGAGFPIATDASQWQINGDTVVVPMVGSLDKSGKIIQKITVKINDKNYTGGRQKSKYYLYNIENA